MPTKAPAKRKFSFPNVYTIAFALIVLFAILTWVVPSGEFDREAVETNVGEREVVVPGSYHQVAKVDEEGNDVRQGLMDILTAPTKGIQDACDVVAFVILIGGTFGIINKTNAVSAGMKRLIKKLKNRSILLIPIVMALFALGGTTFGMAEETIPFFAILLPIIMSMGYDSMTAFFVVFLSANMGYTASTTNPFSVLIAQGLAGVSGNPQLWFRYIQWAIYLALAVGFTLWYALRVRKNPQRSVMYDIDVARRAEMELAASSDKDVDEEFTVRQKLVLIVFAIGMFFVVFGLLKYGWYMDELSAVFFAMGLAAGIVYGMSEKELAETFIAGMADFTYAAITIGFARGILVVAQNGMIMDTILNALVNILQGVPAVVYTTICSIFYSLLSIMLPSSSGMAALTIPIFAPLTQILGINMEALITAYQYGNNNINMVSPMNCVLVAGLALTGIPINKFWKVIWKFWILVTVVGWVFAGVSSLLPV